MTKLLLACACASIALPAHASLRFEKLVVSDVAVLHRSVLGHHDCLVEALAEARVLLEAGRRVWFADCILVDDD